MKMLIVPEVMGRLPRWGGGSPARPGVAGVSVAGRSCARQVQQIFNGTMGKLKQWVALGGQIHLPPGLGAAPDLKCMTVRGQASCTKLSPPSRTAVDGSSGKTSVMLLTFCNNAGRDFEIYLKRTFRSGLMQGGGMKVQIVRKVLHAVCLACMLCPVQVMAENSYVGTAACKDCHEEEYDNFTKFAKKAHSDKSIKIMASDLTEAELAECYACHTTGYGKPGGFVSYEKTPHVADAGCEVCHGPGHDHVESGGDTELIKGKLSMEDCTECHNESRVKAFNFKPLLYGGAH